MAAPPAAPVCDLECLGKNIRIALDPHANTEAIGGAAGSIVLNATAWVRHLGHLFLYALNLLVFLLVGWVLGAAAYAVWWSLALRRGRTPGKSLVGVRIVRQNGAPADWMTVFVREGLKTVLHMMPLGVVFDFLVVVSDVDRPYSLADRFTRTMVVRG